MLGQVPHDCEANDQFVANMHLRKRGPCLVRHVHEIGDAD